MYLSKCNKVYIFTQNVDKAFLIHMICAPCKRKEVISAFCSATKQF